ncbi:hypothetical protein G8759_20085 [Spirosoma aureum]|uniref:Uncharacterized protein n=1 Tax=Spirosoma aureum TaxID=2692134 RepID=A0A6G9AQI1_9BACT|nr:hypothetical protein [Spirosoma aureum]QIP14752.1 hypothetical protein G8759_20085 [Spirosoma aureum]
MAGIRCDTPIGADWEYSLDQLNWQASNKFFELPSGDPFVLGTVYTVYCRNVTAELTADRQIPFGEASSESLIALVKLLDSLQKDGLLHVLLTAIRPETTLLIAAALNAIGFNSGSTTTVLEIDDCGCDEEAEGGLSAGIITNLYLAPLAVSPHNTDFLGTGTNLFNKLSRLNQSGKFIDNTGTVHENQPNYTISHPMLVKGDTWYTPSSDTTDPTGNRQMVAYFSATGAKLDGASNVRTEDKFRTPPGCVYILCTVPNNILHSFQVQEGETATDYENFKLIFPGETTQQALISARASQALLLGQINQARFTTGRNLFDKDSELIQAGRFIDEKGVYSADPTNSVSHPIFVNGDTAYTASFKSFISFYDQLGRHVGGERFDRDDFTFTTPGNAKFALVTVPDELFDSFLFVEGEELGDYEPFVQIVKGKTLGEAAIDLKASQAIALVERGTLNLFKAASRFTQTGRYITNTGLYVADSTYTVSHLIKVSALSWYTPSYKTFVAFFDAAGNLIPSDVGVYNRPTDKFFTPALTEYLLIAVPIEILASFMLVAGQVLPATYQPFVPLLESILPTTLGIKQTALDAKQMAESFTDEIIYSINLFNKADSDLINDKLINENSVLEDFADVSVGGFIPVEPNTWYTPTDLLGIGWFTEDKEPLGNAPRYDRGTAKFQTTDKVAFIRPTVYTANLDSFMLVKGQTLPARYIPWYKKYKGTTQDGSQALAIAESINALLIPTANLFNRRDGSILTGQYINNEGFLGAFLTTSVTHFIKVKASTWYTPSEVGNFIAYFDENFQRLGEGALTSRPAAKFQTTSETAYIRATFNTANRNTYMIVEGQFDLPMAYIEYGSFLDPQVKVSTAAFGKTEIVFGTSIPAGSGYHELACRALGMTCINKAVPSSSVRIKDRSGGVGGANWQNIAYAWAHTLAEKAALISGWAALRSANLGNTNWASAPTSFTSGEQAFILSCSYESNLTPYLNGTYAMPDVFVLSVLYNDQFLGEIEAEWLADPTDTEIANRTTAFGAITYIIDYIRGLQPRAKIVLEGHYADKKTPKVAQLQQKVAAYHCIDIWEIWKKLPFNLRRIPNTLTNWDEEPHFSNKALAEAQDPGCTSLNMDGIRFYMPDWVHPYSDPAHLEPGHASYLIAHEVETHLATTF